ncbi:MAG: putative O-glycosylation ligase (exosortase A-associated) [Alphaproteobacteria bacterium]|jgi:probable O-glycosylation ligase (exosortase A-associated)
MRDIIIMIGFLGLLPLCFSRPFVGILAWSWFAIMNPHRETHGFAYAFQFNMIIAAITFIGIFTSAEKIKPIKGFAIYVMGAFFAWTFITTFSALDPTTSWVFFNATPSRTYIYVIMLIFLVNREERMIALIWIIVISLGYYGASIGMVGLLSAGRNIGRADNFGPTNTMIQDRNHMTIALMMMFPLLLYLHKYTQRIFVKLVLKGTAFLTIVTVIVSYSRTGLICLMLIGGYYFMFLRNKIVILTAIIITAIVSFMFMPAEWQERMSFSTEKIEQDGSLNIRYEAWKLARAIAADNPLTGGGFRIVQNDVAFELYPGVSKNLYAAAAHSIYFEILSDHGYVGLLLFILLIASGLYLNILTRRMTKNYAQLQWVFDLATALQLSLCVYAVGGAALSMAYYDVFYVVIFLSAALNFMASEKINTQKVTKISKYKAVKS